MEFMDFILTVASLGALAGILLWLTNPAPTKLRYIPAMQTYISLMHSEISRSKERGCNYASLGIDRVEIKDNPYFGPGQTEKRYRVLQVEIAKHLVKLAKSEGYQASYSAGEYSFGAWTNDIRVCVKW